jgi:hypothetical protein
MACFHFRCLQNNPLRFQAATWAVKTGIKLSANTSATTGSSNSSGSGSGSSSGSGSGGTVAAIAVALAEAERQMAALARTRTMSRKRGVRFGDQTSSLCALEKEQSEGMKGGATVTVAAAAVPNHKYGNKW